ncbi:IclR family transcriptional regulator [Aminobacterium sp. MB27-C1]|uniref:IclR family transcriptional regulator n=1 Tax=Aminobacterium sp. MB27-C1 TaxID=3070661 RepID=UPI0027DBA367|nr:IclR family transcriptional regulator [Aminobacterium sp. MB27-C1]WMI71467.1 IclR family transcriptional regulator [Aminobacterium sp. MB27-C1]
MVENKENPNKSQIRVIDRVFSILFFMGHAKEPLGVTEIAKSVDLPKATVYRILDSLITHRVVTEREGRYEIGPATLFLADAYRSQVVFSEIARPFLENLNHETKETIHLFIFDREELFYIDKLESPYQVRMHSRVGVKGSLINLSAGKAILSSLQWEDVCRILGVDATQELHEELEEIRLRGYAVDNERNEKGLRCVGSVIVNGSLKPLGGLSLSAPVYRFDSAMITDYGDKVHKTAQAISSALLQYEQKRFKK